jgi:hypothetical protein
VEAPKTALDLGRSLIFSGTVMDISAGTKQDQQAADFPNGVPAASGAIMKDWMGYVYQQQPLPANATGVQVKLTAVDSNGNSHDVGTATSDTNGKYGIAWVPPIVGMYYVKAEFLGTESYWGSQDSAYFVVDAAPSIIPIATPTATPTAAPTATPTPTASPSVVSPPPGGGLGTEYYVAIAAVVIIIAIAAVAVVLRRRK